MLQTLRQISERIERRLSSSKSRLLGVVVGHACPQQRQASVSVSPCARQSSNAAQTVPVVPAVLVEQSQKHRARKCGMAADLMRLAECPS